MSRPAHDRDFPGDPALVLRGDGTWAPDVGGSATHAGLPDVTPAQHHAAFVEADHGALPNPHHSNALDHSGALDHAAAHAIDGAGHTGVLLDGQIPAGIARDAELHAALHSIIGADHSGFPGGTSTFLRADATFAAPPGGGEAFPIGSVFIAVVATNPATLLGYGTWAAFATGRVLVGIDAGQTEFDVVEETGGAKTHTLVTAEVPAHSHLTNRFPTATGGSTGHTVDTSMSGTQVVTNEGTDSVGGGGAHNNLSPYVVVHMWKRTA